METAVLAERLLALDSAGGGGCEPGVLAELVAITERLHTMIAVETAGFDATGELTASGYRSPAGFLAGEGGRVGRGTARRYLSCGRILGQFPLLAAAAEAGEITFDHVATFARLLPASASEHRRACLVRDEAELVAAAKSESVTHFAGRCVSWRHRVDPDDRVEERLARADHGMTVNQLNAGTSELVLRGESGEVEQLRAVINQLADEAWRAQRNTDTTEPVDPATDGKTIGEADHDQQASDDEPAAGEFSSSEEAVRASDWPDSDDDPGEAAGGEPSEPCRERQQPLRGRLISQAAAELAARAQSGSAGGGVAKPVVVVVMDWATFNTEAERFATGATAPPVEVFAPGYRCETLDGHPLPPDQAFLLALRGEVQRCVVGAESLKVDLGREQRLFNAAGRRAVQVRDRTCVHPACELPAVWADIDHIIDWVLTGRTDTVNGQALCRRHHVEKHRRTTGEPEGGDDQPVGRAA